MLAPGERPDSRRGIFFIGLLAPGCQEGGDKASGSRKRPDSRRDILISGSRRVVFFFTAAGSGCWTRCLSLASLASKFKLYDGETALYINIL